MSEEEAINVPELLDRVQDDKELMLELLDIFIEDFQQRREQLAQGLQDEDFESVSGHAHALKGASGNISAPALRKIFITLEEAGKVGDADTIKAALPDLDVEYVRFSEAVKKIKDEA